MRNLEEFQTVTELQCIMFYDTFSILAHRFASKDEFLHWQLWVLVVAAGLLSVSTDNITLAVFTPDQTSLFCKPRTVDIKSVFMGMPTKLHVILGRGGKLSICYHADELLCGFLHTHNQSTSIKVLVFVTDRLRLSL